MKAKILPLAFLLVMAAPAAQASVISIGDPFSGIDTDETITLLVNGANIRTVPGQLPPGSGDVIDTTQANDPAHLLSNINCPVAEHDNPTCAFTFADHDPWNQDTFLYRYFTGVPGTNEAGFFSDLFVIQGYAGENPDYIWFRSSDVLTGDILLDGPALQAGSTAARIDLGTVAENGEWQLAFNTGPDQYYIKSVPEPATLALLGLGLAGLGFSRRKQ